MPFFISHDSQLATLGALAGNIGLNATGQQNFHNQLSANADYRAQNAQDFQQQNAQDSGDDSMYRAILGDITARQLSADRIQSQQDLLGIRGDNQLAGIDARGGFQTSIANSRNATNTAIGAGHDATRTSIAGDANQLGRDKLDETIRNNDLKNQYGYDTMDNARQIAQMKAQAQQDLEQSRTAEQAKRAQTRLEAAAMREQTDQQIKLVAGQMRQLQRARDTAANHYDWSPQQEDAFQKSMDDMRGQIRTHIKNIRAMPTDPANVVQGTGGDQTYTDGEADMTGQSAGDQGPTGDQGDPGQPGAQGIPQPQSVQEYAALPPGAQYVAPDGTVRQKQGGMEGMA